MIKRIMVVGGGTGGHLFPGIAIVEELRRRNPQVEVLFVGTQRGIETRVLPRLGEQLATIDVRPWLGRSPFELLRNIAILPKAASQAAQLLRTHKPELVLGLGGYTAGPVLLLAAAMRIPTALLEQNAHVGLTNRLLSSTVGRAYLTYPETLSMFGSTKGRVLGNPVRRAFVEAAQLALHDPAGVEARARRVLVLGGSQGAKTLNEVVPVALALSSISSQGVSVLHQTGDAMLDEVRRRYRGLGVNAEVVTFIDDMSRAYASASLVVARAGATTLAELCAIGKPSILIPYPHAAEDHQAKNALAMERAGAAIAVRESELTAEGLATQVRELLSGRSRRRDMADAARKLGRPEAAAAIVDDLCAFLGVPADGSAPSDGGDKPREPDNEAEDAGTGAAPSRADGVPMMRSRSVRRARVRRAPLRLRPVEVPIEFTG
jgi:UDP-N-acetylglucosamine--N-acetylmuramyl-(pentapeptide) pyrophosphoryl-undecaprenol N-acetylglucosamine transferase